MKRPPTLPLSRCDQASSLAQSTRHYYESFENDLSGWTLIDQDGDDHNFLIGHVLTGGGPGAFQGRFALESYSWGDVDLSPENNATSPKIDLTALTGANTPSNLPERRAR